MSVGPRTRAATRRRAARRFRRETLLVVGMLAAWGCGGGEPPPASDPASLRRVDQGELVGFRSADGAHVWRGIPYAAPPVGPLRWRAPRPPEPWQGTRDATVFGEACVQSDGLSGHVPGVPDRDDGLLGSEDCLTLDVYAPPFAPEAVPQDFVRLPVMVWIHGGGNTVGTSATYDGGVLAARHGLVVVSIQYRLGVFGWLSHASLAGADASADDRSGNFGLLDQMRALEWVRDNISAFGGDPERVTIFGESAGGRNVLALMASQRAKGLFHRAISQSGATSSYTPARARNLHDDPASPGEPTSSGELVLALLQQDGRADDRASAKEVLAAMSDEEVAAWLRAQPDTALVGFYDADPLFGMSPVPQPIADGHVLPARSILEVFRQSGAASPVPVILGSNRDEDKLFMPATSDAVRRILGVPVWLSDRQRYDLHAEYRALAWKARGVDEPAAALRAKQGPTVYAYRFDWDEEPSLLWLDLSVLLGAAHIVEVPFVFGKLGGILPLGDRLHADEGSEAREAAEKLARQMGSYWASFATRGVPGRGLVYGLELPDWRPWDGSGPFAPRYLVFDTDADGGLRMSPDTVTTETVMMRAAHDERFADERDRCEFFAFLAERGQGIDPQEYASGACAEFPLSDFR